MLCKGVPPLVPVWSHSSTAQRSTAQHTERQSCGSIQSPEATLPFPGSVLSWGTLRSNGTDIIVSVAITPSGSSAARSHPFPPAGSSTWPRPALQGVRRLFHDATARMHHLARVLLVSCMIAVLAAAVVSAASRPVSAPTCHARSTEGRSATNTRQRLSTPHSCCSHLLAGASAGCTAPPTCRCQHACSPPGVGHPRPLASLPQGSSTPPPAPRSPCCSDPPTCHHATTAPPPPPCLPPHAAGPDAARHARVPTKD